MSALSGFLGGSVGVSGDLGLCGPSSCMCCNLWPVRPLACVAISGLCGLSHVLRSLVYVTIFFSLPGVILLLRFSQESLLSFTFFLRCNCLGGDKFSLWTDYVSDYISLYLFSYGWLGYLVKGECWTLCMSKGLALVDSVSTEAQPLFSRLSCYILPHPPLCPDSHL